MKGPPKGTYDLLKLITTDKLMPPEARNTIAYMAVRAGVSGEFFCRQTTLIQTLGRTESRLRSDLRSAEAAGWLQCKHRAKGRVTVYVFRWSSLFDRSRAIGQELENNIPERLPVTGAERLQMAAQAASHP
jgi:hypothetical protein